MANHSPKSPASPDRITEIRPLRSPPGFFSVRRGGQVIARLHRAEVEHAGIMVGSLLDPDTLLRLKIAEARSAVRRDLERLLRRRLLTAHELALELHQLGHAEALTAEIIRIDQAAHAIDDDRLADRAAERDARRGRAASATRRALIARGLDPQAAQTASRAASEAFGDDFTRASALARSRLRPSLRAQPAAVQRRRLAALLARRGHQEHIIEQVLHALLGPDPVD